jgi:hypothetical protein
MVHSPQTLQGHRIVSRETMPMADKNLASGRRVVIIDDEPAFSELLNKLVSGFGYDLKVSSDPRSSRTYELSTLALQGGITLPKRNRANSICWSKSLSAKSCNPGSSPIGANIRKLSLKLSSPHVLRGPIVPRLLVPVWICVLQQRVFRTLHTGTC